MLRPPQVIPEIVDALQVLGSQTIVRWGTLAKLPTQRERIYLLGVEGYVLEPNTRAHHVRREDFRVRGVVEVQWLGDDGPEAITTRAWELLSAVDDVLRDDQSMSDGTRYNGQLAVIVDQASPLTDGWLAQIHFTLGMESVR